MLVQCESDVVKGVLCTIAMVVRVHTSVVLVLETIPHESKTMVITRVTTTIAGGGLGGDG